MREDQNVRTCHGTCDPYYHRNHALRPHFPQTLSSASRTNIAQYIVAQNTPIKITVVSICNVFLLLKIKTIQLNQLIENHYFQ